MLNWLIFYLNWRKSEVALAVEEEEKQQQPKKSVFMANADQISLE